MDFLKKAMATKELVHLSKVGHKNVNNKDAGDWITIGVIASKTETKHTAVSLYLKIFDLIICFVGA